MSFFLFIFKIGSFVACMLCPCVTCRYMVGVEHRTWYARQVFCHCCFPAQNEVYGVDDLEGLNFGVLHLFHPSA